jgi:hypothetical protein
MLAADSTKDVHESADFVIVGSGAAGATCARWLSAAGRSVLVIEEGGPARTARGEGYEASTRLYRNGTSAMTWGRDAMHILQGRCVGGSTVVSGLVMEMMPHDVWQEWVQADPRWEQRLPWDDLMRAHERMDAELSVEKTPRELWGEGGAGLLRGLMGQATPTWRATPGCQGSGRCFQGCPHGGKASADVTLLPRAEKAGARVIPWCRVDRVEIAQGVAVAVHGRFSAGGKLVARAKVAVILAASAPGTVALLHRSGVKNVGEGFQVHPAVAVAGLFPRPMSAGPEATHAMESFAFRDQGLKLESVRLPTSSLAQRVPGVGRQLDQRMQQLPFIGSWNVLLRAEARGRVRRGLLGSWIQYVPTDEDRRKLLKGIAILSEAMLRDEALEVWPGVHGAPETLTRPKQAQDIASMAPVAGAVPLWSAHLFCGVPVDNQFQACGIGKLVVADSSLFPSNLGVSPLATIMAVATLISDRWAGA